MFVRPRVKLVLAKLFVQKQFIIGSGNSTYPVVEWKPTIVFNAVLFA